MHDPMTVAFEIRYPWRAYKHPRTEWEKDYRRSFITVWHVDPEKDGSDDSCDWFGRKLTRREKTLAANLIDNEVDNLRSFFSTFIPAPPCPKHPNWEDCYDDPTCKRGEFVANCDLDEMKGRVMNIFRCYKREFHWRYPVRWHFWHWKFQIHPLQTFKRWAWSRCCRCGKRFSWGASPITGSWYGEGPRWFRSETNCWHDNCDKPSSGDQLAGKQAERVL